MLKTDVLAHFGTQQRVADALTAAGCKISQRAISSWGDRVPLDKAVWIERITRKTANPLRVRFSMYRER